MTTHSARQTDEPAGHSLRTLHCSVSTSSCPGCSASFLVTTVRSYLTSPRGPSIKRALGWTISRPLIIQTSSPPPSVLTRAGEGFRSATQQRCLHLIPQEKEMAAIIYVVTHMVGCDVRQNGGRSKHCTSDHGMMNRWSRREFKENLG